VLTPRHDGGEGVAGTCQLLADVRSVDRRVHHACLPAAPRATRFGALPRDELISSSRRVMLSSPAGAHPAASRTWSGWPLGCGCTGGDRGRCRGPRTCTASSAGRSSPRGPISSCGRGQRRRWTSHIPTGWSPPGHMRSAATRCTWAGRCSTSVLAWPASRRGSSRGVPAAAWWTHRQVTQDERALAEKFGDEFGRYRAAVPRYLPGHRCGRAASALPA